jgi:hypothetical protein
MLPMVMARRGRPLMVASVSEITLITSNHSAVSSLRMLAKLLSLVIAAFMLVLNTCAEHV